MEQATALPKEANRLRKPKRKAAVPEIHSGWGALIAFIIEQADLLGLTLDDEGVTDVRMKVHVTPEGKS